MAWVFAGISLVAAIVCLAVASVVLLRDKKNSLNRVFALLCLAVAYWSFVQFQSRQAPGADAAAFWIKASAFWPFVEALLLHFILVFTRRVRLLANKLTYILIYAPAALIALVDLLTYWITGPPVKVYWGWTSIRPGTPMNVAGDVYVVLWSFLAMYLCFEHYQRQSEPRPRWRAFWVLVGISVPILVGTATDVLLPQLFPFPEFAPAVAAWGIALCAGYAMWRYELFAVTPATAADEILLTMADCLLLTDPSGKILTVNNSACDLIGRSSTALIGGSIDDLLVGAGSRELLEQAAHGAPPARPAGQAESVFETESLGQIPVSLAWSTMTAKDGSTTGIVWIARDIRERREIDRLKSDLIATVSHELRSPLTVIIGSASMVERLYESGRHEACLNAIRRISARSKDMAQLVEGLLDMRRIELGDFAPDLEDVDLAALLEAESREAPVSERHRLSFEAEEDMPRVRCDPHRMKAAFGNVLRNAVKFSPAGGSIDISVTHRDGTAVVSISDQGVGIRRADQNRIFERFVQADMSSRRSFDGAGIGLYIAAEIMGAHGGTVSVDSEPGKGSTFRLELPVEGPKPGGKA